MTDTTSIARCRCGWEHVITGAGDAVVALVSHLSECLPAARQPGVTWAGLGARRAPGGASMEEGCSERRQPLSSTSP